MCRTPCPYLGTDIFCICYLVSVGEAVLLPTKVDGRTAQVNFPCSFIGLSLPTFPVSQVDLEANMAIVYGE